MAQYRILAEVKQRSCPVHYAETHTSQQINKQSPKTVRNKQSCDNLFKALD